MCRSDFLFSFCWWAVILVGSCVWSELAISLCVCNFEWV
jgi:hypothetical protein